VPSAAPLKAAGVARIMVNSNPETVSPDFDASTRLYFEPLDEESLRDVLENETTELAAGSPASLLREGWGGNEVPANASRQDPFTGASQPPVIVQFGGQTAINLAETLYRSGSRVLGSSVDAIDPAEDSERIETLLSRLGIS